ncbi:MipA/OmpV family protein [Sphingomonas sp. R-74633]|uniref:MipA/OmpV family protein n=1 Tax=Sphingomonas sp. R-74633 TaxID=2751188 RepID=UPI0015D25384|nr:MipA/OmpV family protein [Sphingomonas sp. R-74633]NYT41546.1 MipA/OmpV family protein [Sphingomonas sp. R-74633]
MRLIPLAILGSIALASPALAQQERGPTNSETGDFAMVGVGAAILPDYEGSDDYRIVPAPLATGRLSGFGFELAGTRLSVDLIPDYDSGTGLDFQAGPTVNVNLNRTSLKSIEDPRIKALGKIDTGIEVGGFLGVAKTGVFTSDYDRIAFRASYRKDVANASKAGVFNPSITYMTPLSRKAMVGMFLSATRVEKGYATTYFGVTPAGAAASGLAVWNPRGGWKDWTAGLGGAMSLTGDLTHGLQLFAGGTYRKLIGDFGDSPIVRTAGSRSQWLGSVGLAYSF